MTTRADRTIDQLRAGYDDLAKRAAASTPDELAAASGAADWTVAQVLSHLGSAAEINRPVVEAARVGDPRPDDGRATAIWARWDAMSPQEQAEGFVESYRSLVEAYEGLDAEEREHLRIDLGFLPQPVEVATAAAFMLHEQALHAWDVAVASDPGAALSTGAAELGLEVAPYLIGFIGRSREVLGADREVALRVELTDVDRTLHLRLADQVTFVDGADGADGEDGADRADGGAPDAVLRIPVEAWLRLVAGRLAPEHTPDGVDVSGAITLDELRRVFPGY